MKKYKIIYADPPWSFKNKNTGGSMISGASAKYNTMTVKDICNLPVSQIVDDNCILFMWWVASQPEEALAVVKSWGFKLKTMTGFNWIKTTKTGKMDFGMGFWTRAGSECCLIATKGKPKRINGSVRSVVVSSKAEHSKKPKIIRDKIVELCGDIPRIELFARQTTNGWDAWGNEVDSNIELIN